MNPVFTLLHNPFPRYIVNFFFYYSSISALHSPLYTMHPKTQTSTHFLQPSHTTYSIAARDSSKLIEPEGQIFAHLLQPMHPFEHISLTRAPFSVFLHITATLTGMGCMEITSVGQIFAQTAQPLHFLGSILANPFSMQIASLGQTFKQSPSPRQPNVQAPLPP